MFVSFLEPYHIRGVKAPYLWVFYKQINNFKKNEIVFIASDEYFQNPLIYTHREEFKEYPRYKNEYSIPSYEEINQYKKFTIPLDIYKPLEEKMKNKTEIFRYLLVNEYPPLIEYLDRFFKQLKDDVEAVLAWVNSPSLNKIAQKYGIKVIYNELGPLRKPSYFQTAYFDFKGVNGNTQSKDRYEQFLKEDIELFEIEEIREIFLKSFYIDDYASRYKIGVALQVEDDSNMLAYSNGYDNFKLINEVFFYYDKKDVLIRKHPLGLMELNKSLVNLDDSKNSIEFINKCEKIVTINSSVGFEALFFGKDVYAKGDSPYSFFVSSDLNDVCCDKKELKKFLNFFLFSYLIPYSLLYDKEYYKFRLSDPSEKEIFEFHKNYILENKSLELIKEEKISFLINEKNILEEQNRELKNAVKTKNELIRKQQNTIQEKNEIIQKIQTVIQEKNELIQKLQKTIDDKNIKLNALSKKREELKNTINEKDAIIESKEKIIKDQKAQVQKLTNTIDSLKRKVVNYENEILMYFTSDSWKITRPLRKIIKKIKGKDA